MKSKQTENFLEKNVKAEKIWEMWEIHWEKDKNRQDTESYEHSLRNLAIFSFVTMYVFRKRAELWCVDIWQQTNSQLYGLTNTTYKCILNSLI